MRAFVSGSTGYIGSRLIPALLEAGHEVTAGMRYPSRAANYVWSNEVTVQNFDLNHADTVKAALDGNDVAYFLVHSLSSAGYRRRDAQAAQRFAAACDDSSVSHIVYLSGLIPTGHLSHHLKSRLDLERVFLDAQTPATVLRAAIVLGAGSIPFELIYRLVKQLPILLIPRWMNHRVQPIAAEDVITDLLTVGTSTANNEHIDIGGPDQLTYSTLLTIMSDELGLTRRQVPVPWLPHQLVGLLAGKITGIPATTVTELVKSLDNDMVCVDTGPFRHRMSVKEAIRRSIANPETGTHINGDRQTLASSDPKWSQRSR